MKDERVYITRNSFSSYVRVWPATVGIRKFHGCVEYGAAWSANCTKRLRLRTNSKMAILLFSWKCQKKYGFYPPRGTAWYWNGKKATQVFLDFSG